MKSLFDYFLVLDFEATCEDGKKLPDQEIIEFPGVLIDADANKVVSEFQRYVRPVRNPTLSAFCTSLTGIEQATVDKAQPFPIVYAEFNAWLASGGIGDTSPQKSVAVVTCGDWDLKTMLPLQLALCNEGAMTPLPCPAFFRRWVNIKTVFGRHLSPSGQAPRGMPDMLKVIGKPLVGRHHSGIDDCRNIATILQECLHRGVTVDFTWPANVSPSHWRGSIAQPPPIRNVIDDAPKPPAPFGSGVAGLDKAPQEKPASEVRDASKRQRRPTEDVGLLPPVVVDPRRPNAAAEMLQSPPPGPKGRPLKDSEVAGMSKKVSWLLRHGAIEEGLPMTINGFVPVSALLAHRTLGKRLSPLMLAELVSNSDKQRFALVFDKDGELFIRANQGHSIEGLDLGMHQVRAAEEVPVAIHGTYHNAWRIIRNEGLNRMGRQHIHFATGLPGDSGIISGMRSSCEIFIYLNVPLALNDGIPLFISSNGVVLSPGIDGVIPPKYFLRVVDPKTSTAE